MGDAAWARFRRHGRLPRASAVALPSALITAFVLLGRHLDAARCRDTKNLGTVWQ